MCNVTFIVWLERAVAMSAADHALRELMRCVISRPTDEQILYDFRHTFIREHLRVRARTDQLGIGGAAALPTTFLTFGTGEVRGLRINGELHEFHIPWNRTCIFNMQVAPYFIIADGVKHALGCYDDMVCDGYTIDAGSETYVLCAA